jgi:glycosyltransferase involved in cell wall biosynthesis
MELSIIIPCKNEERYIGKLLDSILVQEMPIEYEIIIADANSSDKTLLIIDKYRDVLPIKVIEGGLPSFGRNNGARVASGDIFLFLDADCYFDDKFIIFRGMKSSVRKYSRDTMISNKNGDDDIRIYMSKGKFSENEIRSANGIIMKNIFTIKFRVISNNSIDNDRKWEFNIGIGKKNRREDYG